MPRMPSNKSRITVYIPDDLKAEAEKLAAKDARSLSNLVVHLLQEAIEKAQKEGKI